MNANEIKTLLDNAVNDMKDYKFIADVMEFNNASYLADTARKNAQAASQRAAKLQVEYVNLNGDKINDVTVPAPEVKLIDYMIGTGENDELVINVGKHGIYTGAVVENFPDFS